MQLGGFSAQIIHLSIFDFSFLFSFDIDILPELTLFEQSLTTAILLFSLLNSNVADILLFLDLIEFLFESIIPPEIYEKMKLFLRPLLLSLLIFGLFGEGRLNDARFRIEGVYSGEL